jgi:hypothetical protein
MLNIKMLVLQNAITKNHQEKIKEVLLGNNFPWYYIKDITKSQETNTKGRPGFFHNFVKNSVVTSDYYKDIAEEIFLKSCEKANIIPNQLLNCRSFLQLPLSNSIVNNIIIDDFHVDLTFYHNVMIYYVIDNESNTLISEKSFDDNCNNIEKIDLENTKIYKINPEQGKSIFFCGNYFHSAEQPLHTPRCIINFNFI